MSARRRTWQPYEPMPAEVLELAAYGERRHRDAADLTTLPAPTVSDWLFGLRALVLAVGGALLVVASWSLLWRALGLA